jgi:hypothetical protein
MMYQRNYPDPSYEHDYESEFLVSPVKRRLLWGYSFGRFLVTSLILFFILLGASTYFSAFSVGYWVALFLTIAISMGLVRVSFFRKVPLRCSRCARHMGREMRDLKGDRGAIFYVCHPCKRYIDSGVSED